MNNGLRLKEYLYKYTLSVHHVFKWRNYSKRLFLLHTSYKQRKGIINITVGIYLKYHYVSILLTHT